MSEILVRLMPAGLQKAFELEDEATCAEVLKAMDLHPDAYLIMKEEKPIPLDTKLEDGDEITFIAVASGG